MKPSSRIREVLGSLGHGAHPLEGKSIYMHSVKINITALITDGIKRLGGRIEAFLNRDVSFVVTGREKGQKPDQFVKTTGVAKPVTEDAASKVQARAKFPTGQSTIATMCGSRGRALLEKAMNNTERVLSGDVLASARSWGVKIISLDDFLWCLDLLTERSKPRRKLQTKGSGTSAKRVVKAGVLKEPFIKVEDNSRKYRPFYAQSMNFPELNYEGRYSPFETASRHSRKARHTNLDPPENKNVCSPASADVSVNPSPKGPRKKNPGYCECCQQTFTYQEEHLRSEQHRHFVEDTENYSILDGLIGSLDGTLPLSRLTLSSPVSTLLCTSISPDVCHESSKHAQQVHHTPTLTNLLISDTNIVLDLVSPSKPLDIDDTSSVQLLSNMGSSQIPIHTLTSFHTHCLDIPKQAHQVVTTEEGLISPRPISERGEGVIDSCLPNTQPNPAHTNMAGHSSYNGLPLGHPGEGVELSRHDNCPEGVTLVQDMICDMTVGEMDNSPPVLLPCQAVLDVSLRKRCPTEPSHPSPKRRRTDSAEHMSEPLMPLPLSLTPPPDLCKEPMTMSCALELEPPVLFPYFLYDTPTKSSQHQHRNPPTLSPKIRLPVKECVVPMEDWSCGSSSSESDWDSGLLSRLAPAVATRGPQQTELEVLLQTCTSLQDTSYQKRLCSALHTLTTSSC